MPTNDASMADMTQLYDTDSNLYGLWFAIFWVTTNTYQKQPQMHPIRLVALLGHEKVLKWMLQSNKNYDVDRSDDAGRTALVWACEFGYEKVVQILLDQGADVNAQGGKYGNALQAASQRGHEKVVQMLLKQGAKAV
ncbi:hypothetical protein PMZ80_003079 [Knufia obscura]|uniref:Uncharacterized protein n=1 Tax=Knufia obscura TaxID=1635080 RepID=A0ABR0RT81_9EURO|nr:hypothetical protein PMZ80_003079 [Knufia obscura]